MIEELFYEVPVVTRIMCLTAFSLTLITYLELPWRIFTNIFYFGDLQIHTLFKLNMFYSFSRKLEESSFRGNSIDYLFFIITGIFMMTGIASFYGIFNLSESFLTMILYFWGRRNSNQMVHILGLLPVMAPYIPWIFVFLSIIYDNSIVTNLIGIMIGHMFYFFIDIYPQLKYSKDIQILKTPQVFKIMCTSIGMKDENLFNQFEIDQMQQQGLFGF